MDTNPVSSSVLEERVAMYLQAIEYATAANDHDRRQVLEKDIQTLMDLMERVNMGQVVLGNTVPPPLQVHSHIGEPLANPLGELSARLADYHKALYYADIEMMGDGRTQQIQTLQRGLQVIQKLQEKAQAGHPIRPEDIPPPVPIPAEDEFVVDSKWVIAERMALYYQALELAQEEGKQVRVNTLKKGIQKLEYLLQRADSNIPIYKKDLPCSPALGPKFRQQTEQYRTTVELLSKMSGLSVRAAKLAGERGDKEKEKRLQHNAKMLTWALQSFEAGKPLDMSSCPYSLADIQRLADEAGVPGSQHLQDAETVRLRCNQYKLQALKAKRSGSTELALQHMRVVKGLQSLLQAAERGEAIDMTQVPPPPSEQTPTTEEEARLLTQTSSPPTHRKEKMEADSEMEGKTLAEELSAFLFDNGPSPEGSSSSSSGLSEKNGNSPPTRGDPASISSQSTETVEGHHECSPAHTLLANTSPSSGLNPVYALTQTPPQTPSTVRTEGSCVSQGVQQPPAVAPIIPSQGLKPAGELWQLAPGQAPMVTVNGVGHVPLVPVPTEQGRQQDGGRGEGLQTVFKQTAPPAALDSNGVLQFSSDTSCIEIMKYEQMLLNKEGRSEAQVAAERLGRQLEDAKRRLREGGYQAWLDYLGGVEEVVSTINSHMKAAREEGREDQLAMLVIKKELAERELAVMRKRLPELQT